MGELDFRCLRYVGQDPFFMCGVKALCVMGLLVRACETTTQYRVYEVCLVHFSSAFLDAGGAFAMAIKRYRATPSPTNSLNAKL